MKKVIEVFSFHMGSTRPKHQIVDLSIQGLSMVFTGVNSL